MEHEEESHGELDTIEDVETNDTTSNLIEIGLAGSNDSDEKDTHNENTLPETDADGTEETPPANSGSGDSETSSNNSSDTTEPLSADKEQPALENRSGTVSLQLFGTRDGVVKTEHDNDHSGTSEGDKPNTNIVGQSEGSSNDDKSNEFTSGEMPTTQNITGPCSTPRNRNGCSDCGRYNIQNNNYQGKFKVNIFVYEATEKRGIVGNQSGTGCG